MLILVLNCGSSSIKFQLFDFSKNESLLTRGLVERIGIRGGNLKRCVNGVTHTLYEQLIPDHTIGIKLILESLVHEQYKVIDRIEDIDAVGHRVVHGAEVFAKSVVVDELVKEQILKCAELAPLHNPANLNGILSMETVLPGIAQVAVFDTSFHQTMPEKAYLYGIPYEYYEKYKIRRYGFHGISHQYVAQRACELTHKDFSNSKIITCHLGNGASITAIKDGQSVDTSMGFTPVTGLMMGTRCGTLDPGILLYLEEKEHLSIKGINNLINKQSGLQGISGISSDMRDVEKAADDGIHRAKLALDMYTYRVRKWIGALTAVMNGIDLVVFTGGIGENSYRVRQKVCDELSYLGIQLDDYKNMEGCGEDSIISSLYSEVRVAVVKTNEELVIARETLRLVNKERIEK
jgi:acetate kinase